MNRYIGRHAIVVAVVMISIVTSISNSIAETPAPCEKGPYGSCQGRVVVDAGQEWFDLGLYYAGPDGVAHRVKGTPDSCAGCQWETTVSCNGNRPADPDANQPVPINCVRAAQACPGGVLMDVWLKRPGEPWMRVDTMCVPIGSRVASPADLAPDVAEAFRRLPVPAPRVTVQPTGASVVRIPTIFFADGEQAHTADLSIAGFAVRLTATTTRWHWIFGEDGATQTTTDPGAPYPHQTVQYAYQESGAKQATVTSEWMGSYVIAGVGATLPVDERVSRTTTTTIDVRTARAELIGNR